ncbi:MAG: cyclic lactone autoinducer peptide [Hungatella sp.]|jgi:cyclic lactone autoinducer peptide|nr:cyclic lactone autoinducer peptide [Hungatella sp.]
MKKETVIKLNKWLCTFAIMIAVIEANSPCPFLTYQPEKPDSVKKLRKF